MARTSSKEFIIRKAMSKTGAEAYEAIIEELENQIDELREMLTTLRNPHVRDSFVESWNPDTDTITIEE